jgi:hypothetical protein
MAVTPRAVQPRGGLRALLKPPRGEVEGSELYIVMGQTGGQGANSFSFFSQDIIGERSRQPLHQALPFRSSQRLAHVRGAPHFQPRREPSARRHCPFPNQLPQRQLPRIAPRQPLQILRHQSGRFDPFHHQSLRLLQSVRHSLRRPQVRRRLRRLKSCAHKSSQLRGKLLSTPIPPAPQMTRHASTSSGNGTKPLWRPYDSAAGPVLPSSSSGPPLYRDIPVSPFQHPRPASSASFLWHCIAPARLLQG